MKNIKKQVEEHNKRAIEEQQQLAACKKEEEEIVKPYVKGLSDDLNVLTTECVVLNRGGNQVDWELGRRLIKVQFLMRGQFQTWLKDNGITRYKAYRIMREIRSIPDVDLKLLSRKPLEIDALPGEVEDEIIDGDALNEKLDKGEAGPADFARRSPTDVKKLLTKIEILQQEKTALEGGNRELLREIDVMKLGTIEEVKIREWIFRWQLEWIGGRNRVLALLTEVSEAAQMDVFAALQWFGREIMTLEMECSRRWPDYSVMSDSDQAALGVWLDRRGAASPIERIQTTGATGATGEEGEEENHQGTETRRAAQPLGAEGKPHGCDHFMRLPAHLGGGPLKEYVCSHVQGDCEVKECCRNCGKTQCNGRCAHARENTEEARTTTVYSMGGKPQTIKRAAKKRGGKR